MKKLFYVLVAVAAGIFLNNLAVAAEHPGEHPGTPAKEEHKEHLSKTHTEEHPGKKEMLSANAIIKAIEDHISAVTAANNGYYPFTDAEEGKDLKLTLVKVHEDKVSYIKKEDAYFACADFTAEGGAAYDLGFWMKKNPEGKPEVYQTKIHKKDGTPRFTYQDDEIAPVE